jgi:DNA-binding GntR family transcriptional regulator
MHRIKRSKNGNAESSLTEISVTEILRLIRVGEIPMGSRLGEVALSNRLKMGRAPVRAALDRLASMGVVERIARSGTFVREVSPNDYCEIMDVRAGLESMAGFLATLRISEEQLDRLEKIAAQLDALDDQGTPERLSQETVMAHFDKLFALDFEFHMGIAQVCGNKRILALLEQQHLMERSFILGIGLPPRKSQRMGDHPSHMDIVKAIRAGDPRVVRDIIMASMIGTKEGAIRRFSGYQMEHAL